MAWKDTYPKDRAPSAEEIDACVGSPLWGALCRTVEETYGAAPRIEYSCCSMAPGWNVKYKKGGRALCTLYPNEGYFSCMVVVGERVLPEAELLVTACDPYTQELFRNTKVSMGGKWLYIDVKSEPVLRDTLRFISLRAPLFSSAPARGVFLPGGQTGPGRITGGPAF